MNQTDFRAFAAKIGISEIGVSKAEFLTDLYDILSVQREKYAVCPFEEENLILRCDPTKMLAGAKSIVTCLFPYYSPNVAPVNLSRYAAVRDYHAVVREKLEQLAAYFKQCCGAESVCFSDNSPMCDRFLAQRAGLGFYGKNHMLINKRFGSYFFIGSLITTAELEPNEPCKESCMNCGKCFNSCPGGALTEDGFDYRRCISYLTQSKELTEEQEALLQQQKTVYGCDVCQEVCPHNQGLAESIMAEFSENTLRELPQEIVDMSNREFQRNYHEYPFAWRGRKTIVRNFRKKI